MLWLLFCVAPCAAAQQLEPHAYSNVPVGLNFIIAGYTYSSGGLATDPSQPLDNAQLDINAPFVAYARAFDAWGKSAKFDAVLAAACLSGTAESNGVPVSRDICGGLDPALRVTVNLFGAPAMSLAEFRRYRQDVIVGVSLQVGVPLGQYDPDRLVNLGTNRWTFRPEIGVSKKFGALTAEAAVGASFYTTNDDFFGGKRREQDPVASAQLHLIFELVSGSWLALNGTYYGGGRTTVNGVEQNDELGNSRLGATFAWSLDRNHRSSCTRATASRYARATTSPPSGLPGNTAGGLTSRPGRAGRGARPASWRRMHTPVQQVEGSHRFG